MKYKADTLKPYVKWKWRLSLSVCVCIAIDCCRQCSSVNNNNKNSKTSISFLITTPQFCVQQIEWKLPSLRLIHWFLFIRNISFIAFCENLERTDDGWHLKSESVYILFYYLCMTHTHTHMKYFIFILFIFLLRLLLHHTFIMYICVNRQANQRHISEFVIKNTLDFCCRIIKSIQRMQMCVYVFEWIIFMKNQQQQTQQIFGC